MFRSVGQCKGKHKMFRRVCLTFSVVFVSCLFCCAAIADDGGAVHDLTTSTFHNFINNNEAVLVKFFVSWCQHCKDLIPEFQKAAELLKGENITLARVNLTSETALGQEYRVEAYPTLKFFRNGTLKGDYAGGRTAQNIVKWAKTMKHDSVEIVDSVSAALNAGGSSVVYVGTFSGNNTKFQNFTKVADVFRHNAKFYAVIGDAEIDGKILVKREHEDEVVYDGNLDFESLKNWVKVESLTLFGSIDGSNYADYSAKGLEMIWLCGNSGHYEKYSVAVRESAKALKNKYSFVWLDSDTFPDHTSGTFGVNQLPSLVAQLKNGRYILDDVEKISKSSGIISFLEDCENGNVRRSLKSEKPPETNDGNVKVVVASNFEEMVFHNDKDVMLMVYASWCGHCKQMKPEYEKFGASMKKFSDKIVVAQVEGSLNESPVPEFEWRGFPTVYFLKAGTKVPIVYDGERKAESFEKFVRLHGTVKLDAPPDKGEEL